MPEITVTRADREMAAEAYVPHGSYNHPDFIGAWAADGEFGSVPEVDDGEDALVEWHVMERRFAERERLQAIAAAIAKARAEGVEEGRARCVQAISALRDAVATGEHGFEGNTSCFADEMDGLIKSVESGNE